MLPGQWLPVVNALPAGSDAITGVLDPPAAACECDRIAGPAMTQEFDEPILLDCR
jgi:hypothetical protein